MVDAEDIWVFEVVDIVLLTMLVLLEVKVVEEVVVLVEVVSSMIVTLTGALDVSPPSRVS